MPVTIDELLLACGVIAVGFLFAVAFYESLSTRDVLVARSMRITRRLSDRRWFVGGAYVLTVGVGIPVLVVLWTLVLEATLFFVGSVDRVASVAFIAVAVVGATRILAYIRERTAHELAKAVPLSFAFLLLTGGALHLEDKLTRALERPEATSLTFEMVAFLVVLEIALRLLTDGSHAALGAIRRRRGVPGDLGVWRTVRAAIHHPLPAAPDDPPLAETAAADRADA